MRPAVTIKAIIAIVGACAAVDAWSVDAGVVKKLQGEVRVERAGKSSPLHVGDGVQEADRVVVGPAGSVGITLRDETLISLGPNAALVIDGFAFDAKTNQGRVETSILRGSMRYVTGLIGRVHPKSIRVSTAVATIGIRGTDFIVEVGDAN